MMMIIELFVYVFIASMMVVCVNVMDKTGIVKKSDFIFFYVLLSLIISQIITVLIFNPDIPQLQGDIPSITYVSIGTILVLGLIYIITLIVESSTEIQEYARTSTGWGMFLAFGAGFFGILIWYPDTKMDLYRMPFALALCIGMQYYPSVFDRLVKMKDVPEEDVEGENEAAFNAITEMSMEEHKDAIIELATEAWCLAKIFERAIIQLKIEQPRRYTSRIEWFVKKAEESLNHVGLRIVNVEGHVYDPGMAAAPINMEEFDVDDYLVVNSMVEPIIMEGTVLVKRGKVSLRRTDS